MTFPTDGTRVAHIVLTGGPSAGKSSALGFVAEQMTARGWRVLTVPEAATVLITGGITDIGVLATRDRDTYLAVQRQLVGIQLDLHARYDAIARSLRTERVLVLHDRGVADNAAYMSTGEYADVLAGHDLDVASAYGRYDAVIHLRSAAVARAGYTGAGYTRANNTARREDAAAAADLDEATLAAWTAHPHLAVVSPAAEFATKLHRTLHAVARALGDPEPLEVERKFALSRTPDLTHPVLADAPQVLIEQVYLPTTDAGEQRVRSRTVAGVTTYVHTTKRDTTVAAARVEVEIPISEETYRMLTALRDPATVPVRKVRRLFVVGDQRFELDEFLAPEAGWLLETEVLDAADPVEVPGFLGRVVEVTDDPAWRNRSLAADAAR